jgi:hypothetical protein
VSASIENLCSLRRNFYEVWYLSMNRKSEEKIKVSLKSDKNNVRALYMKTGARGGAVG